MHNVVFWATKVDVQKSSFIYVSYDEFTTIDNQSWLSVHVYVIEEWKKGPNFAKLATCGRWNNFQKSDLPRCEESDGIWRFE
jgi:hypothetical protein